MTLSTADNVVRYIAAADQTVFAYGFRVDDDSHLQVYVDSLLQSGGYAVAGIGSDVGGNVTFSSAPRATGEGAKTVTLLRKVPLSQTTDLPTQGALPTEAIEDELDRLVMRTQQLDEVDARSFKVPVESTIGGATLELTPQASTLIGWDGAGAALANYASSTLAPGILPTAFMETLLADATAAAALTTLGLSMAPVQVSNDNAAYPTAGTITLQEGTLHYTVERAPSGSGAFQVGTIAAAAGMADGTVIHLRRHTAGNATYLSHDQGNIRLLGETDTYLLTHRPIRLMLVGGIWYEQRGKGLVGVRSIAATTSYTRPDGVTHVLAMLIGGGGGGGGVSANAADRYSLSGGGGGMAIGFYGIADQTSVAVTIGAGGIGGLAGSNDGGAGGTTSFGSYISAGGGPGGPGANSGAANKLAGGLGSGGNIKNIYGCETALPMVLPNGQKASGTGVPGWPFGPGGVAYSNWSGTTTNWGSLNYPGQGGHGRSADASDAVAYSGQDGSDGHCIIWEYAL